MEGGVAVGRKVKERKKEGGEEDAEGGGERDEGGCGDDG